jgi:F-type H+-transporting ATPase subunit b
MITIDLTMPIQIANILILIVIMNAVLYKPIRSILEERKKRLAGLDKDIETFNKNAELRLEEFDQKIQDARVNAKATLEDARKTAHDQSGEKISAIRKDVDSSKAEQLGSIKKQFESAQQELKGQIDGFAADIASKVLGRAL